MKECPKCGFTFPDFHHVCDFDGTDLVPEQERPSPVNVSRLKSRFRRCLNSPLLLASLTAFVLLSSALLIGYFDSTSQPGPVARGATAASSDVNVPPVARAADQSPFRIKPLVHAAHKSTIIKTHKWSTHSMSARVHEASRHAVARSHRRTTLGSEPRKSEVVRQSNPQPTLRPQQVSNAQPSARAQHISYPQQASHDKDSKLTTMMKSTWHVLKRPFKF